MISLLDYGAGNVRSLSNAIEALGERIQVINGPEDILNAEKLVFPGVGAFGAMMDRLSRKGYVAPLKAYLSSGRPFLGICLGMHALFEGSEEAPGVDGLGFLKGRVRRFRTHLSVPHMGWNGIRPMQPSILFSGLNGDERFYFVHSYHVEAGDSADVLTLTDYDRPFASAVQKGRVVATQFHPEKSGPAGLRLLSNFLQDGVTPVRPPRAPEKTELARRIISCLDVRANDQGELVVTKGDRYDVREDGAVRNMGNPVEMARRYYRQGADEITFLNITGYRDFPLKDMPMIRVLNETSKAVFVPLTIGGGIRDFTDNQGRFYTALDVVDTYFRSGADKISIGSDAVFVVESFLQKGTGTGTSAIETISRVYGNQAVVISIDPMRVYAASPDAVSHPVIETAFPGPNGERYCWYQCTVQGGRQRRDVDALTVARVCETLGGGEILVNCIDRDGTRSGFDIELVRAVKSAVSIPVIASSGAGSAAHFLDVFTRTPVEAALGAGIFHRREVSIGDVKACLKGKVPIRRDAEYPEGQAAAD